MSFRCGDRNRLYMEIQRPSLCINYLIMKNPEDSFFGVIFKVSAQMVELHTIGPDMNCGLILYQIYCAHICVHCARAEKSLIGADPVL